MRDRARGMAPPAQAVPRLQPVVRMGSGMMTRSPRLDAGIAGCWV
ncbi:MAG TPA: hypothetical protein VGD69_30525 [Herpetosiphonaceae bacterium]